MIRGQQVALLGQAHHFGEQLRDHCMLQQAVAILAEGRVVPHRIVDAQPDKPSEQQVVMRLLDQLPFAANAVQHLQQLSAQQALRRNRLTSAFGVRHVEQGRDALERRIEQGTDWPDRMIGRNEAFQAHRREQRLLHHIRTAHENSDLDTVRKGYQVRVGMRENFNSLLVDQPTCPWHVARMHGDACGH